VQRGGQTLLTSEEGQEDLRKWQAKDQSVDSTALLAHALLAKKGISCKLASAKKQLASATRQIRRWQKKHKTSL
jgi:hypothetical protein